MAPQSPPNGPPSRIVLMLQDGLAHHKRGQVGEAWKIYQDVIKLQPRNAHALHCAGVIAAQAGRFDEAVDLIGRAIKVDPKIADAHFNLGNALRELKRFREALASYDKAIQIQKNFADAYNNRGNTLKEMKNLKAAIASYDKAIELNPSYADAYNNRGNALKDIMDLPAAVASFDKAIALMPNFPGLYYNRGLALYALKRYPAALNDFEKATSLNPALAEAFHARGQVLADLRQFPAAIEQYAKAIKIRSDYAEVYNSRGTAWNELQQNDAALAAYGTAIGLKTDFIAAYSNRAKLLGDMRRHAEAVADYDRILGLDPDYLGIYGARLHARMQTCDWQTVEQDIAALADKIGHGKRVAAPFQVLALTDSAALHRQAAELWTAEVSPRDPALGPIAKRERREQIRIGYFSMDFRIHPVAQLVVGLIESHDRARFEIIGFSYGLDTQDPMRKRLESAFDKFIDVRGVSDKDVAAQARALEVDIAVDLAGHTGASRTAIFAMQAAPVQVNYLGYPGTMGSAVYDYIVADRTVIADEVRHHYAEKIVYLPHSYQPNDTSRAVSERVFTREELGLPPTGFVFCCFNNTFKITPGIFDAWMRILTRVDGSVLWLLEDNPTAAANLRLEAARRGVAPERLVFAGRAPQDEHLARQRAADLFLDTLPYNAHTTASDALWVGLPLLTCTGEAFAGRVGASILRALDLSELVAATAEDYEVRAIALATEPGKLDGIKRRLMENRQTAPLFNIGHTARHIEAAYAAMYERYHADQPPEDIRVAS